MKAVNLIPKESRRGPSEFRVGTVGPGHFVIGIGGLLVVLVLLHVLAANSVKEHKVTLAAVQAQVAQEQAVAARLRVYTSYVEAAQAREQGIRDIADSRFSWQRSFDQLSHAIPATTTLTSLDATTAGTGALNPGSTTAPTGIPVFTLQGCADTRNQDGVATLMRHLGAITDVSTIAFSTSTRLGGDCPGNNFQLSIDFRSPTPGTTSGAARGTSGSTR
jgi:Tfp pilus assembly protein PilN